MRPCIHGKLHLSLLDGNKTGVLHPFPESHPGSWVLVPRHGLYVLVRPSSKGVTLASQLVSYRVSWHQPATRTVCESSVVRLRVEVHLHHLAPAPWQEAPVDVPKISPPTVLVNATAHHLAVNNVEGIPWPGKTAPLRSAMVHVSQHVEKPTLGSDRRSEG